MDGTGHQGVGADFIRQHRNGRFVSDSLRSANPLGYAKS